MISATVFTVFTVCSALGQTTLEECIGLALANYPQLAEADVIDESERYDLSSAGLNWVPQLNITGKATYQSDVVEMPFEIPGYDFNLPKDQYSIVAEITQSLWDGGTTGSMKRQIKASADLKRRQLDVNLYSVRGTVENVYLGILLVQKQIVQNEILMKSLERRKDEVSAMIENGVAYRSDMDVVDVNILDCRQSLSQLDSDRRNYLAVLSKLTGKDMSDAVLEEPSSEMNTDSIIISRPELAMYDAQLDLNTAQRQDLNTRISPKFNVFVQGGIGQPGLNMLKKGFEPYYVAGLRMQWDIGSLYTRSNDIRKVEADRRDVEIARETFLFNTSIDIMNKINEIEKAREVLRQDKAIIGLRESIRKSGEEQYRNGVIKMTDLMDMIDDEHNARITESLHQVQLLVAVYSLKNSIGE